MKLLLVRFVASEGHSIGAFAVFLRYSINMSAMSVGFIFSSDDSMD